MTSGTSNGGATTAQVSASNGGQAAEDRRLPNWVHRLAGAFSSEPEAKPDGEWLEKLGGRTPPHPVTSSLTLYYSTATGNTHWNLNPECKEGREAADSVWTAFRNSTSDVTNAALSVEAQIDWLQGPGRVAGTNDNQLLADLKYAAMRLRLELRYAVEEWTNNEWRWSLAERIPFIAHSAEPVSASNGTNRFRVTWKVRAPLALYSVRYDRLDRLSGVLLSVVGAGPAEPGRLSTGIPGALDFAGRPRESHFPIELPLFYSAANFYLAGIDWVGVGWDQL